MNSIKTNLGPQQVASDETLELLLGNAPCDSSSLIIPCTTYQFSQRKISQLLSKSKIRVCLYRQKTIISKFTFRKSLDWAESKIGHTLSKSCKKIIQKISYYTIRKKLNVVLHFIYSIIWELKNRSLRKRYYFGGLSWAAERWQDEVQQLFAQFRVGMAE